MNVLSVALTITALVVAARADDLTNAQEQWLMMPENHICPPLDDQQRCAPIIARLPREIEIMRCAMDDHENETMAAFHQCGERLLSEPARRADCYWALLDKSIHESGNYPRRHGNVPKVAAAPEMDRAAAWRNLTSDERRKCDGIATMTRDAFAMRKAGVPAQQGQVRLFNAPRSEAGDRGDRSTLALDVSLAVNVAYDRKTCPDLDTCVEETRLRCAAGKQIEKDAAAGKLSMPRAMPEESPESPTVAILGDAMPAPEKPAQAARPAAQGAPDTDAPAKDAYAAAADRWRAKAQGQGLGGSEGGSGPTGGPSPDAADQEVKPKWWTVELHTNLGRTKAIGPCTGDNDAYAPFKSRAIFGPTCSMQHDLAPDGGVYVLHCPQLRFTVAWTASEAACTEIYERFQW